MQMRAAFLLLLLGTSALGGCAKTKVTRGPHGMFRFECARGMKDCVAQAEKYCNVQDKDGGYIIVGGVSRKIMMGAEAGQYRTAAEVAELEVQCGAKNEQLGQEQETRRYSLPPRTDEAPEEFAPAPAVAAPPAAVAAACTKGATQACVGPGACQGGQVCLADGSGYGPCDCGGGAPAPAKLPAPVAPDAPPVPAPGQGAQPLNKP